MTVSLGRHLLLVGNHAAHRVADRAQLHDLQHAAVADPHVTRLDVAVDQPLLVNMGQPQCGVANQAASGPVGQGPVAVEALLECLAPEVLKREVVGRAVLPDLKRPHDVGMLQFDAGAKLALHSGDFFGIVLQRTGKHLEADRLIEFVVHGAVDVAQAAGGHVLEDAVRPEHERPGMPCLQRLALKLGEQLLPDEPVDQLLAGSILGAPGLLRPAVDIPVGRFGRHQPAVDEPLPGSVDTTHWVSLPIVEDNELFSYSRPVLPGRPPRCGRTPSPPIFQSVSAFKGTCNGAGLAISDRDGVLCPILVNTSSRQSGSSDGSGS